ncbi:MAG: hypothetical protein M1832_001850 [Thelocarpon impressellum]|nr:MAG: hypothetical protein M1832_001850 [Thelocarpon impressellum]
MPELDPLISDFSHLKEMRRGDEALKALQKVASLVKPLMRQRGWRVGTLAEFYPPEPNLLGVNWNKGQKICLRLRYPGDDRQFMPMEQVVDTMLHELSHNVHSAHDAKFHALWQQLRDEHEQLTRKGYTGEGFLSDGRKLGGRRIPMDEARRRARASAEKRRVLSAGSGQKLGGHAVRRGSDMRKVIADATQRRLTTVTKGCGSGSKNSKAIVDQATRNGFRTQAEEDDANERAIMQAYIELLQEEEREKWGAGYEPPSERNPTGGVPGSGSSSGEPMDVDDSPSETSETEQAPPGKAPPPPTAPTRPSTTRPPPTSASSSALPPPPPRQADTWQCEVCTLDNPPSFLCCDACGTERPEGVTARLAVSQASASSAAASKGKWRGSLSGGVGAGEAKGREREGREKERREKESGPLGWVCHSCGTFVEAQWWTCAGCGVMKLSS